MKAKSIETPATLAEEVRGFLRRDFHPHFGERADEFPSNATWRRLRDLGTEIWLDTGDIDAAACLWTSQHTALTTNNTMLNKEVQKGRYDALIPQAAKLLDGHPGMTDRRRMLEIAFILNAAHALK